MALPDGGEDTFAVMPPAPTDPELQAQAQQARAVLEGLLPLLPPEFAQQLQQPHRTASDPVDLKCARARLIASLSCAGRA